MNHYYVFFRDHNYRPWPVYERTCGTEDAALDRVRTLEKQGRSSAFFMLNELPERFWS